MFKSKLTTCTSLAFLTVATACVKEKTQVYKLNIILLYMRMIWDMVIRDGATMVPWGSKIETGNNKNIQLYDIISDKEEQNNLATQQPEKVKEMQKLLQSVRDSKVKRENVGN